MAFRSTLRTLARYDVKPHLDKLWHSHTPLEGEVIPLGEAHTAVRATVSCVSVCSVHPRACTRRRAPVRANGGGHGSRVTPVVVAEVCITKRAVEGHHVLACAVYHGDALWFITRRCAWCVLVCACV